MANKKSKKQLEDHTELHRKAKELKDQESYRAKKKKSKKYRQYRSNQGRSPQDMESKYQGCIWTAGFGFVLILGAGLWELILWLSKVIAG